MSEVCLIWSKGLKSSSTNHLTSSKLSCCKSKTCRYRNSKLRNLTHHEGVMLEVSSFYTLIPQYRENYL
ncbi:hypothetical protein QL285_020783 [Trifolium repens]|nr:hypothetical protein QL285_017927 [Trifolium repens]KAK2435744.1 hypothetical protein QL285_020783 [Trifolium repens]